MIEVKDCVVTLCLDLEDMKALIAEAGTTEVHKALGYAVSYGAIGQYDTVNIRRDGRGADILCVYERGEHCFVMGGIWRPERSTYTFHS